MLHTFRFSLQNAVYFIMLSFLVPVLFTKGLVMGLDTKPKSHLADYKHQFLSHSFQYFRGAGEGVFAVSWRIDDDDNTNTVELVYNGLGLSDTSSITLYILWYQLIP
jgi:hypothetical protein